MNKEAQRIAIAQACGYWFGASEDDPAEYWHHRDHTSVAKALVIPDYLSDLNAMHEAEKVLSIHQRIEHGKQLQETTCECVVGYVGDYHRELVGLSRLASATAPQRAEAFLKTLGLWEDAK